MVRGLGTTKLAVTGVKLGATAVGAASLTFLGLMVSDSSHNGGKELPARAAAVTPTPPQIALVAPLNIPPPALPSRTRQDARPQTPHVTARPAHDVAKPSPTPDATDAAAAAVVQEKTPQPPAKRPPEHNDRPAFWHALPTKAPAPTPRPAASPGPTCGPRGCDHQNTGGADPGQGGPGGPGHGGHHH